MIQESKQWKNLDAHEGESDRETKLSSFFFDRRHLESSKYPI